MAEGQDAAAVSASRESLTKLATRLQDAKWVRRGEIVFRISGDAPGNFALRCTGRDVELVESPAVGAESPPLIEIMGKANVIRSLVSGEKDARKLFLSGGFRVRGDLRYVSELAQELGLLEEPL